MKRKLAIILILSLGLSLVGCGTKDDNTVSTNNKPAATDSNKDNDNDKDDNKVQEEIKEVSLSIYTADDETLSPIEVTAFKVDEKLPLQDKLKSLGNELSKNVFQGLPINIIRIEIVDGKKVAIVNLDEIDETKSPNWSHQYFQGSTGGSITVKALVETFLQKKYTGEWIDGVQFLYKEYPVKFQHVEDLIRSFYR